MKKRTKQILLIGSVLLVCALMLTACGGGEAEHTHSFGEWTTTKEASCVQKGEAERVCECGEKETKVIDEVHEPKAIPAIEPSCAGIGKTEGSRCINCGAILVEQQVIAALPHTEKVLPAVEPTKHTEGKTEGVECGVCHAVLVAQQTIPALAPPADVWNGAVANAFAGGSGTESDPYLISTGAQLAFLAKAINDTANNAYYDKYYKLTNDIDLNGKEWTPIGLYKSKDETKQFQGFFDGDGFEVYNFKITKGYSPCYYGLFGRAVNGAIQNLGVTNFTIKLTCNGHVNAGGLVGSSTSTLTNCYAKGVVEVSAKKDSDATYLSANVGGLTGYGKVAITNCYADVTVIVTGTAQYGQARHSANLHVGGLVGFAEENTITNCYATGRVSATAKGENAYAYAYVGGLVGHDTKSTITKCYATGEVSATGSITGYEYAYAYAGGLVGESFSSITNCYATGKVTAITKGNNGYMHRSFAGGLVGYSGGNSIIGCYASGDINATATGKNHGEAQSRAGGLVGFNDDMERIENCFAVGNVTVKASSIRIHVFGSRLLGGGTTETLTNYYYYEGQTVMVNDEKKELGGDDVDKVCTKQQLDDAAFYTDTLGWDATVWDLSNLNVAKKICPVFATAEP